MNDIVKVMFYCPPCKKYIPQSKVLSAVHIKAMCPVCYNYTSMQEKRKVNGKIIDLYVYLNSKS